jgi:hypothetical protein
MYIWVSKLIAFDRRFFDIALILFLPKLFLVFILFLIALFVVQIEFMGRGWTH